MTFGSAASRYLIGKEDSYGSEATTDKLVGAVQEVTDNNSAEILRVPKGIGSRGLDQIERGTIDVGDSVTMHYQNGRIFEYALGSVSHSEDGDDWVHTFTLDSTVPSFTSEVSEEAGDNVEGTVKTGNMVDSFTVSIELNGLLTVAFTTLAADADKTDSPSTKQTSDLYRFGHGDVSVYIDSDESIPEVQNFSISFEGAVTRAYGIGSKSAKQGASNEANFTFSGTVGISSNKYNELFNDATEHDVELVADNGKSLGSGQRKLDIKLTKCKLSNKEKAVSVGDLTFVDIEGEGILDTFETVDNISENDW